MSDQEQQRGAEGSPLGNEPGPGHARPIEQPGDPSGAESGRGGDDAGGAGDAASNVQKHPDEWKTGDEPMTGAQASYLQTLSQEAGEDFDPELTKAEASKRIDELRARTGRGG